MPEATWDGQDWQGTPKTIRCPNCGRLVLEVRQLSTGEWRCIRCSKQDPAR
jgi:ribosomal protein L37AE/L43A